MISDLDDRHARMLGLKRAAEIFSPNPWIRAELWASDRNCCASSAHGDYQRQVQPDARRRGGLAHGDLVESGVSTVDLRRGAIGIVPRAGRTLVAGQSAPL